MSHRRVITEVDPKVVGFNDGDLSNAIILDHLTPKTRELLSEACKKFNARYNYAYCWANNQVIYLRQAEDSRPSELKILVYCIGWGWREVTLNL